MSRFNRSASSSDPARARLWNSLALLFTGLTVLSCLCMSAIFAFPQAPFNPFPPDDDAQPTVAIPPTDADLGLSTSTAVPTLGELPSEQTATPAQGQPTASAVAPVTETPGGAASDGTGTVTPTATPQPPIDTPAATATFGGYPGGATATPTSTATSAGPYP